MNFSLQLIFRKVSDVLKEQELAERRKNDPVLNHTQDHLVRKLFNKFKKGPDPGPPAVGGGSIVGPQSDKVNRDIEKGENNIPKTEVTPPSVDKLDDDVSTAVAKKSPEPPKPKPAGLKGWGRLRGDRAPAPPATAPKVEESTPAPQIIKEEEKKKSEQVKKVEVIPVNPVISTPVEYQAINDRLNHIEKLINDLMVKVDDKTRSIERTMAKVKSSSKSKYSKPQSVTICVDSASSASGQPGTSQQGAAGSNCDEQFL